MNFVKKLYLRYRLKTVALRGVCDYYLLWIREMPLLEWFLCP